MKLRIWSHLPQKSLMENFIFCAVRAFWKRAFLFLDKVIPNNDFHDEAVVKCHAPVIKILLYMMVIYK